MKFEQVLELVKAVSDSKVTSLEYKEGETKVAIKVASESSQKQSLPSPVGDQVIRDVWEEEITNHKIDHGNVINCPLVGTFYSAASEEAEAYVKVGDPVKKGQTIAIVEAMKLMNEIESDYDGVIQEILVNNAQGVEYGQPLFVIQ